MPELWTLLAFTWLITLELLRRFCGSKTWECCNGTTISLAKGAVLWETRWLNGCINALGERPWFAQTPIPAHLAGLRHLDAFAPLPRRTLHGKIQVALSAWFVLGAVTFAIAQSALFLALLGGAWAALDRLLRSAPLAHVAEAAALRPVIPGVNLPASEGPALAAALVLALAFHELGHALAASTERVKTEGAGLFVALVVPGAFVRLEEGLLPQLPPRAQLKVYCAGAWHNLALTALSLLAAWAMPLLLSPLFGPAHGPVTPRAAARGAPKVPLDGLGLEEVSFSRWGVALQLPASSAFFGLASILPNDGLHSLDDLPVLSSKSFSNALLAIEARAQHSTPLSFLVPTPGTAAVPPVEGGHQGRSDAGWASGSAAGGGGVPAAEVVQLQGWCLDASNIGGGHGESTPGGTEEGECFVVGRRRDDAAFWAARSGDGAAFSAAAGATQSEDDQHELVCLRSSRVVAEARRFSRAHHTPRVRSEASFSSPGPVLLTCRRSSDCPQHARAGGAHEAASCARAVLTAGESLVAVALQS
mmetsp:Transcript_18829/g.42780  ORF Transcript_18829/g.42780 Transcript_18829/m.42780 type:complete len:533 (+) Transcript_18829:58-1656(+)